MATIDRYAIQLDTSQATAALDSFKSALAGIGAALAGQQLVQIAANFENLRVTLGILFKDTKKGAEAFDDIKQFAATSIFSVEDLTETVIKLKTAGINPTVDRLRLFADTSSVAADSVGALKAITDLFARTTAGGLGLEDLNRLADRGIPVFDILQKTLGLSRLELSKFGQTAEGAQVILQALEQGLQEQFGGASAARAGTLSQALSNLKDAAANALDTIGQSGFTDAFGNAIRLATQWIDKNKELFESIGKKLAGAIQFLVTNIDILTKAAIAFFTYFAVTRIAALAKAFVLLSRAIVATPIGRIAALAALAVGAFVDLGDKTEDSSKEFEKLNEQFKVLEKEPAKAVVNLKDKVAGLNEEAKKQKRQLEEVTAAYKKSTDAIINGLKRQGEALSLTEEQQKIAEEIATIEEQRQEKLNELTQKYNNLDAKARAERLSDYEKQKQLINENADAAKQAAEDQIRINTTLAESYKILQNTSQAYNNIATKIFEKGVRNAIDLADSVDQRITLEEKLNQITQIRSALLEKTAGLSEEEKAKVIDVISIATTQSRLMTKNYEDINAEITKYIEIQAKMGVISEAAAYKILESTRGQREAITKGAEALREIGIRSNEVSRSFSVGWNQAFKEYVDNATNAANAAKNIFQKATQGMEDLLVDFVKTGKFEWKNFVASMAEELLRSQIRQLMASIFNLNVGKSGGNAGSLLGNLFAGFFANGGSIPAGKFGVVGERGAEFVAGPATVTPMNASQTVVYNINAVDAPSFKSMIARDPSFIHAVAMQGAAGMPIRR